MRILFNIISAISALLIFSGSLVQDEFPLLEGPYLGQKLPGIEPKIFAPGVVSTQWQHGRIAFSPDGQEVYFVNLDLSPKLRNGTILVSKQKNGRWTRPQPTSFSGQFWDDSPIYSPDGKRLYFHSMRPFQSGAENINIWFVDRLNDGWSEPGRVGPPIDSQKSESGPTFTQDGTIYFASSREGTKGGSDIYRSTLKAGAYTIPINLGGAVNTIETEFSPLIALDESYILFSRSRGKPRGVSLYISFQKEGGMWTTAKDIGKEINGARFASFSPDGKYLFYEGFGRSGFYWIDAKIIEKFRPEK